MKGIRCALILGLLAAGSAQAAILYQTDFETNPSASFTVKTSTADTEADFAFVYTAYAVTAPTSAITIPLAPNSGSTTPNKGLKLRSNFDLSGSAEGVTAFVNASTGLANWKLTWDAFQMWNGPDGASGTGTTTSMTFGNADTNNPMYGTPATFNGWFLVMTGEGGQGASGDFRRYFASTGVPAQSLTDFNPVFPSNMPGLAAEWPTVFPTSNPSLIAGTPGRQWVTWELKVDAGTATIKVKAAGQSTQTQIASWTQTGALTCGIGFWDFNNSSVADPPADNFVLVDNLKLETTGTDVETWALYN